MADTDALFIEHRHGVFRYLCRLIGQAEPARDLTQEVFLRISRAGVPDADPAGLRAWVFRIARNLALNHLRDQSRTPRPAEAADQAEPAVQEIGVAIRQALDRLPAIDRDVFLLREAAGLSYREIADTCDISVEGVRARLYRTRSELRRCLDGPLRTHRRHPVRLWEGKDHD